jgi:5'-nucleotidase
VAAAKQATLLGLRGIALSMPAIKDEPNFDIIKPSAARVLEILLKDPKLTLVNVNFPDETPKGLRWTRQSVRQYDGRVVPGEDPLGRKHFWFSVIPLEGAEEGTDRWAIEQGYVSMTPLRLDLTNETELAAATTRHPLDK